MILLWSGDQAALNQIQLFFLTVDSRQEGGRKQEGSGGNAFNDVYLYILIPNGGIKAPNSI